MRHKLEGNGLWETSRMMLPEHRERIREDNYLRDNYRGERPVLDDQERENVNRALSKSLRLRIPARVKLYDPYEDCEVIGVVDGIDTYTKTFKVDGDRFKLADIVRVDIYDDD